MEIFLATTLFIVCVGLAYNLGKLSGMKQTKKIYQKHLIGPVMEIATRKEIEELRTRVNNHDWSWLEDEQQWIDKHNKEKE